MVCIPINFVFVFFFFRMIYILESMPCYVNLSRVEIKGLFNIKYVFSIYICIYINFIK